VPDLEADVFARFYHHVFNEVFDECAYFHSHAYFVLVHFQLGEAHARVPSGWHLDQSLGVAGTDIHLIHVLETLKVDHAGLNIEVDLWPNGGSPLAFLYFFEGTVDAVLEGEVGIVPDNSLV